MDDFNNLIIYKLITIVNISRIFDMNSYTAVAWSSTLIYCSTWEIFQQSHVGYKLLIPLLFSTYVYRLKPFFMKAIQ